MVDGKSDDHIVGECLLQYLADLNTVRLALPKHKYQVACLTSICSAIILC